MPTPVGPAPPDPNDPDLWDEWYTDDDDDDDDVVGPSRFGWPVRLIALVIVLAVAAIYIFG